MPGDNRINVRATSEQIEYLKRAAAVKGISLTRLIMGSAKAVADKLLAEKNGLVATSAVQEVSEKLRQSPSEVRKVSRPAGSFGPDTPIGEMSLAQIRRYLATEEAEQD